MNHAVPVGGMMFIGHEELSTWGRLRDVLRHLLLPVAVLVLADISIVIRHVRASVGEVSPGPLDWGYRATTELESGHDSCALALTCQALNQQFSTRKRSVMSQTMLQKLAQRERPVLE